MSEEAIIFVNINAKEQTLEEVYKKVDSLEKIEKAAIVAGPYDIIAWAKAEKTEGISHLIQKIRDIDGVEKTTTNVVIKPK